uniref:Uncharacterized protein n=1 Tax=Arundo donax TaxID=35708 RepID=A0A0A9GLB7_ARUDO
MVTEDSTRKLKGPTILCFEIQ